MLRIKIPVGNTRLEAEGDNENELETAVRVALRVAETWPIASTSHNQSHGRNFDEDETKVERAEGDASSFPEPPLSAHDDSPMPQPKQTKGLPPAGYRSPQYEGLKKREQLCLAVCDLNVNYQEPDPSANRILKHLAHTGGTLATKAVDQAAIARQAMRTHEGTISTGTGWRATDEAVRDFVARGLLWVQGQESTERSEKEIESSQLKVEAEENSEVTRDTHSHFSPSSFNSLKS